MAKSKRGTKDEETWVFTIGWASNFEVVVVLTSDIIKSREARNDTLGNVKMDHAVQGLFCAKGLNGYIFLDHKFDPDTVSHESYHLVDYIMATLGVKERDAELMAYHLGWIVGKISELYLIVKKRKAKKHLTAKKTKRKVVSRGSAGSSKRAKQRRRTQAVPLKKR